MTLSNIKYNAVQGYERRVEPRLLVIMLVSVLVLSIVAVTQASNLVPFNSPYTDSFAGTKKSSSVNPNPATNTDKSSTTNNWGASVPWTSGFSPQNLTTRSTYSQPMMSSTQAPQVSPGQVLPTNSQVNSITPAAGSVPVVNPVSDPIQNTTVEPAPVNVPIPAVSVCVDPLCIQL